jgi:hypothetical protein
MRLRDWRFDIVLVPELDSMASIECTPNRQHAVIRLGEQYFDSDAEQQRHCLVHELVHPHLDGIRTAACTIQDAVGQQTYGVFARNHDDQLERATDQLATMISGGVMTPSEWAAKGK